MMCVNKEQEVIRIADTVCMRPIAAIEAEIIAIGLARYTERGCAVRIARELGIGRSTLYRKIKLYGLKAP